MVLPMLDTPVLMLLRMELPMELPEKLGILGIPEKLFFFSMTPPPPPTPLASSSRARGGSPYAIELHELEDAARLFPRSRVHLATRSKPNFLGGRLRMDPTPQITKMARLTGIVLALALGVGAAHDFSVKLNCGEKCVK